MIINIAKDRIVDFEYYFDQLPENQAFIECYFQTLKEVNLNAHLDKKLKRCPYYFSAKMIANATKRLDLYNRDAVGDEGMFYAETYSLILGFIHLLKNDFVEISPHPECVKHFIHTLKDSGSNPYQFPHTKRGDYE